MSVLLLRVPTLIVSLRKIFPNADIHYQADNDQICLSFGRLNSYVKYNHDNVTIRSDDGGLTILNTPNPDHVDIAIAICDT